MSGTRLAAVLGCSGPRLTAEERAFFNDVRPWGFILFARNVEDPAQVRTLVAELRESVEDEFAPVLIDQEGGRVQRLRPPHWRNLPAAEKIGALAPDESQEAAWTLGRLIAEDLSGLGIAIACAPVLDLRRTETHAVIGDRAFGAEPETVASLGRSLCRGLLDGGVLPVTKHIPGHGRATLDSHEALPRVDTGLDELLATDFKAFELLNDVPLSMTAHVVFEAIDAEHPASTSVRVISEIVRGAIGFEGLLLSDDLSMKALGGGLEARAAAVRQAGCDIALHCNGEMLEMRAVAAGAGALDGRAARRAEAALAWPREIQTCDTAALRGRLDSLIPR
ncbi:MAG: beta-N-acetylhexosaminidase [Rhodovibrionaceae bacterium]